MTRPIDALPVEILAQIFEEACDSPRPRRSPRRSSTDRANLDNFSLVHSRWRHPAQALSLAYVNVKITAMHNGAADLRRLCERNPDFASCVRALRINQFSATAISSDGETLPACRAIAIACPKLRHLKLKLLTSSFQDLLLFPSSDIESLEIETSESEYRPVFQPRSEPPNLPSRCRHLTTDKDTFEYVCSESQRYSTAQATSATSLWPALASLTLVRTSSSSHPQARQPRQPRTEPCGEHMPMLRALLCSVADKRWIEALGWQRSVLTRLLWTVSWQNFVDYMPPWREFGDDDEVAHGTHSLQLRQLYILPLPFDPIPPHFLDELTRRIAHDPSLRHLEGLWLPTRGWYPLVDGATGESALEGARRFLRGCAACGVTVEWVDDYDKEGKEMPERYRQWAIAAALEER